ncbi:MAG: NAD-dependent epimerase/dehydratase family protein [Chloroflexota bacterium]
MIVLVTGASGFLGRHVVAALASAGLMVETLHRGQSLEGHRHHQVDVRSPEARAAAGAADVIVHLAGRGNVAESLARPFEYNDLNAVGTLNLLEGARHRGAHFILSSTQRIYAPSEGRMPEDHRVAPADPYAVAKLVAERWVGMYARFCELPATILRFFSVYGPGQVGQGNSGVVSIFAQRARAGLPLVVHQEQRRDLTWASDAAHGVLLAIQNPSAHAQLRTYNVATGVGTSLEELARTICRLLGSSSPVVPATQTAAEGDRVANIDRARRELGYAPEVSVEQGLRALLGTGA